MIGFAIWVIGLVLTIKAALEIWRVNGDTAKKLLLICLVGIGIKLNPEINRKL